jgi:hypothetical protein
MPFGFHAPKYFKINWLSNRLALSVPDEDYLNYLTNVNFNNTLLIVIMKHTIEQSNKVTETKQTNMWWNM